MFPSEAVQQLMAYVGQSHMVRPLHGWRGGDGAHRAGDSRAGGDRIVLRNTTLDADFRWIFLPVHRDGRYREVTGAQGVGRAAGEQ